MSLLSLNSQIKMLQISVIFIVLAVINSTTANFYRDCGSIGGKFKDIKVNECKNTDSVCILKKNTNATMAITFTANEPLESLTAVVHGKVLGMVVPFPIPNSNACFKSGLLCPLAEGVPYIYETSLPILNKYPSVSVEIKFELQDKFNKDTVCISFRAKIK